MKDRIYDKTEIAVIQLEKTICLYEAGEYIPATTLAGAAEEILGKMIKHHNTEHLNELDRQVHDEKMISDFLDKEPRTETDIRQSLNHPRNHLKHFIEEEVFLTPRISALHLIQRAITNYYMINSRLTPSIEEFYSKLENDKN